MPTAQTIPRLRQARLLAHSHIGEPPVYAQVRLTDLRPMPGFLCTQPEMPISASAYTEFVNPASRQDLGGKSNNFRQVLKR
jgi:hypothetical protein